MKDILNFTVLILGHLSLFRISVWQAELTFIHFSDIQNTYCGYPK